ncbi:MAG: LPS export ABC transporter periplasmic protein LptC [Alkalispirochaeta sp.]
MLRNNAGSRVAFLVLWFITLGGCTFDYSGAGVERESEERIPQVELVDVEMVIKRSNRLHLSASRIASYPDEGYQDLKDLRFSEFGPNGELRLEGRADEGRLDLNTEDVELRGNVSFYSTVEEATITSSFLYWNAEERVLSSAGDSSHDAQVVLERQDGSRVEGRGMEVDGRRNSVSFSGGVQGVYRDESDEEE